MLTKNSTNCFPRLQINVKNHLLHIGGIFHLYSSEIWQQQIACINGKLFENKEFFKRVLVFVRDELNI